MNLSRRVFLSRSSIGIALAGAIALIPGLVTNLKLPVIPAGQFGGDQLVAHVRSISSGEISLLVGTTEVVHRDKDLVQRLAQAAAGHGGR